MFKRLLKNGWYGLIFGLLGLAALPVAADEAADAQSLVSNARGVFRNFLEDPEMEWFRDRLGEAKAVVIVPTYVKAGFIFGGGGGKGVLLGQTARGKWTGPVFYNVASASVGLQAGIEAAELVLLVMTQKGLDALLGTKLQLGGDATVAAGPVGAGVQAATADVLTYTRAQGAFLGLSLDGTVITPDDSYNSAYYGKVVVPSDVLVRQTASTPKGEALLKEVGAAVRNK